MLQYTEGRRCRTPVVPLSSASRGSTELGRQPATKRHGEAEQKARMPIISPRGTKGISILQWLARS